MALNMLNDFKLDLGSLSSGSSLATLVVLSVILVYFKNHQTKRETPLPPGPRPLPILGNILDMPSKDEWLTLTRWGQQYGEPFELFIDVLKLSLNLFYQGMSSEFLFLDATSFSSIR